MIQKAFELYRNKFGTKAQIIKSIEELAELQVELCKHLNNQNQMIDITDEMADVEIVMYQLKQIFNNTKAIEKRKQFKVDRMIKRIKILPT